MTNFAFIMDLLKISSKKFSDIGFDKSLVSRWRRGKLRLMPNRHIVKSIAELFWVIDLSSQTPVLTDILNIWYPAEPCASDAERQCLLERFLTEKGQFSKEYEEIRNTRLGKMVNHDNAVAFVASKGIDAAKLRFLDFLDLVEKSANTVKIEAVYPRGRGAVAFDTDFNTKLFAKLDKIFDKGSKLDAFICSDDAISNFTYTYNKNLIHLLKGYVTNKYFDNLDAETKEIFLATAGNSAAITITEEEAFRTETTVSMIYTDEENVQNVQERIRAFSAHAKTKEYLNFFEKPDNYLRHVHISPDSPCYMFLRLPYFGISKAEDFLDLFSLTGTELEFAQAEIMPFLLTPSYYAAYTPVRHIFSESDIELALKKNDISRRNSPLF